MVPIRTATLDAKPKSRPGGRSERISAAVRETTIAILLEDGASALTLESVAMRAEVNRTTLYRRWGNKSRLVTWALLETVSAEVPYADKGSLEKDLLVVLSGVSKFLGSPLANAILQIMTFDAETDPEIRTAISEFWESRIDSTVEVFDRAVERGELPVNLDQDRLIDHLFGPIYLRRITGRGNVNQRYLKSLINDVLTRSTPGIS